MLLSLSSCCNPDLLSPPVRYCFQLIVLYITCWKKVHRAQGDVFIACRVRSTVHHPKIFNYYNDMIWCRQKQQILTFEKLITDWMINRLFCWTINHLIVSAQVCYQSGWCLVYTRTDSELHCSQLVSSNPKLLVWQINKTGKVYLQWHATRCH